MVRSHISEIQLALGAPLASQFLIQVENNGRRRSRVEPKCPARGVRSNRGHPIFCGSHISEIRLALRAPLASQFLIQVENKGRRRSRVQPKMSSERREKQQGAPHFLWSTPLNEKFRIQGPALLANVCFQIVPGICAVGESDVKELSRPTARRGP